MRTTTEIPKKIAGRVKVQKKLIAESTEYSYTSGSLGDHILVSQTGITMPEMLDSTLDITRLLQGNRESKRLS